MDMGRWLLTGSRCHVVVRAILSDEFLFTIFMRFISVLYGFPAFIDQLELHKLQCHFSPSLHKRYGQASNEVWDSA